MERLFILLLLLVSCSSSKLQQDSNTEFSQNKPDSNLSQNEVYNSNTSVSVEDWATVVNDEKTRIVSVSAVGKTPDGEVHTSLKLQCPTTAKQENSITSFDYSVSNPGKIPSFNFNYFEGPGAPALKKKLVEIRTNSPKGNLYWLFAAAGWSDGSAFLFSPSTYNKPDRTTEFAQMIANGSAEVTITVYDSRDNQKVIKTTFPAIDASSEVAKSLKGCRP